MLSNILDRISFWALFAVIALLPIFFLPFTKLPVETSKGFLLVAGLVVSVIFWTAARLSDGKIAIPRSKILLSGLGIVLAFLLSALLSKALKVSFFGTMLDVGTFWFIFGAFLLMLMSAISLRDEKNAKTVLFGVIFSSALLLVFQTFHLFIPNILSLGVLGDNTGNLFGSLNAFGIFAGFSVIISLFVLEFFNLEKRMKWILYAVVALSLFQIAVVNFSTVWVLLGLFSLFIFVYKISFSVNKNSEDKKGSFPAFPFAVTMISLLFFMSGNAIGGFLPNRLGVSNLEVRPSFSTTMLVTKGALMKNPIFGAGPNRFSEVWDLNKSTLINSTPFWDASFDFGTGTLPTFMSTTGVVGILAWLAFLTLLIIAGVKSLFASQKKNTLDYTSIAFFIASLYFFISSFFYSSGPAIFLLGFAFAGAFVGNFALNNPKGDISFSFLDDPRKSFFSILLLVFIMMGSAALSFEYMGRIASVHYLQNTITAKDIPSAEANIAKAISLYSNDLYYRTYSQVYVAKLNSLAAKGGASLSDTDKAALQASLDQAISGAQAAITFDPTNYLNYKALGSVYDTAASLGVKDAGTKAAAAYTTALTLNPLNPGLKLALATDSFMAGNMQEAKDFANQALSLKSDYVDALLMLSQIAKKTGNNADALSYAQAALSASPQDKNLIQYVNSLKNPSVSPVSTVSPVVTSPKKK